MAHLSITRRTGSLVAGVVPPSGVPLSQQTLGVGIWLGSGGELADPALRAELLRLARLRRELRAGHLARAARIALDVNIRALPNDPGTTRTVAVLRSVGACSDASEPPQGEALLRESLTMLGEHVPPALLDALLAPPSLLPPDLVERVFLARGTSPATLSRLRVLLVRRAAVDLSAGWSPAALATLEHRIEQVQGSHVHVLFSDWAGMVREAARKSDHGKVSKLVAALGPNLPLTDPRNKELHEALKTCFAFRGLEAENQRRLVRLSFSAWSTLRDVQEGAGSAELTSFSAQAAAFRQVFEILLVGGVLKRFLDSTAGQMRTGLLDALRGSRATLGIGRWFGMLFTDQRPDPLTVAVRDWFQGDEALAPLREHQRLRASLAELLQVRLHALPHDEESARAGAAGVLETVARVGFGAVGLGTVPKKGEGLVGQLCRVAI